MRGCRGIQEEISCLPVHDSEVGSDSDYLALQSLPSIYFYIICVSFITVHSVKGQGCFGSVRESGCVLRMLL